MAFLDDPNGSAAEKNVGFSQNVLKYGFVTIGFVFLSSLLMSVAAMTGGAAIQLIVLIAMCGIFVTIWVRQISEHRDKDLGGFISFERAFIITLLSMTITGLALGTFQYVYLNFIAPHELETVLEQAKGWLANGAVTADKLDAHMDNVRATMQSPRLILQFAVTVIICGSIISVIMAAILKKPRINS
jgi:Ca2+/Na+ antiporter